MPRNLSTAMLAAIQAPELLPAIFVELGFRSASIGLSYTYYLWSGVGNVTWNGNTWLGFGALLGVSVIEDAANTEARSVTITVSGLDTYMLPDALNDIQLGAPVTVYLALYSGGSIIATPVAAWAGRMGQPEIVCGGDTFTIALSCETRLVDMNIPVDRRYTNPDQQMTWPGDLGMQFVDGLQEVTLFWMQQATTTNNI